MHLKRLVPADYVSRNKFMYFCALLINHLYLLLLYVFPVREPFMTCCAASLILPVPFIQSCIELFKNTTLSINYAICLSAQVLHC